MRRSEIPYRHIDWVLVVCYLILVFFGWINIHASAYSDTARGIFDLSTKGGMQFIWIMTGLFTGSLLIFAVSSRWYLSTTWLLYAGVCLLLVGVLFLGKEINGSRSWFSLGPVSFQPSELSKITTSLALSTLMSRHGFRITRWPDFLRAVLALAVPAGLIILEPEVGTILVYAGFLFVFYREGLSGWILVFLGICILLFVLTLKYSPFVSLTVTFGLFGLLRSFLSRFPLFYLPGYLAATILLAFLPRLLRIPFLEPLERIGADYLALGLILAYAAVLGIRAVRHRLATLKPALLGLIGCLAVIFSVEMVFEHILQSHHQARIEELLGIRNDPHGIGYNVNQSMIAIGSGGFAGKGYLQGTQTKFKFVPEQSTDFIFCTVGEEWGFLGSFGLIAVYFILIARILAVAEKQRDAQVRIYGYCVAAVFFMHVLINICMTVGLMPVIGIPLPFISYGGSSLLSFTVLLFIFIRLDLERWKR